jgi:hypothetical protein
MRALGASRTSVIPGGVLAGNWARDPLWKNARAVPSLDLRFAENKSLTDAKTGASLITFTRASTGTYVGSDGLLQSATTNEARFDHNPTTGESLGLLVEEARTNLAIASQDFANSAYGLFDMSLSSSTQTAPDNSASAGLLLETATTASHAIGRAAPDGNITSVAATSYTFSVFVKNAGRDFLQITANTGQVTNNPRANYNLNANTLGTVDASCTASITPYANGWKRLSFTITASGTVLRFLIGTISSSTAARFESIAGDITKGFYVWGYSVEAGAFATSYIPTTTATVTRAADVASITGTNFSSFYNQTEGTFFVDSNQASLAPASRLVSASDNTGSNRVILSRGSGSSGNINTSVTNAGSAQVSALLLGTSLAAGTSNKVAGVYKAADFAGSVNGLTAVTQGTGTVPGSLTQLTIGNGEILGANPMTGTIKRLTYWPTRLANPTLQSITTP